MKLHELPLHGGSRVRLFGRVQFLQSLKKSIMKKILLTLLSVT